MKTVCLQFNKKKLKAEVELPASKSISNRLLLLNALAESPQKINNLSDAQDTQVLSKLLMSSDTTLDVGDAGTAMRFLLAYCSLLRPGTVLTGSERMLERPQGPLLEALRQAGAKIRCLGEEGFAPILVEQSIDTKSKSVSIRGDISSQYISALMMIAPCLDNGLEIRLTSPLSSMPYVYMTASLMKDFGVEVNISSDVITVPHAKYQAVEKTVESDWSAASYWYAMAAIAPEAEVLLKGLKKNTIQGDVAIDTIMLDIGVVSEERTEGIVLRSNNKTIDNLELDMADTPDLAQTLIAVAAAKGVSLKLKGCDSLRIKETDRIAAMRNEMEKFGVTLSVAEEYINVKPSSLKKAEGTLKTYNDHRMAMSLASIAIQQPVCIENTLTVNKSYPNFWTELKKAGFSVEYI